MRILFSDGERLTLNKMYALGSYSQPESDCFSYPRELRLLFSK